MTVKELSKLYHLNREVELNKRQLERLETDCAEDERLLAELRSAIGDCSSPPLSDMPKAHNVSSPVENMVMRIGQLLRQLFTLRFVNGLPWEQSAFSLWGASGRGETARKMCYRYLKDDKST